MATKPIGETSASPNEQFKGSNYEELENYLRGQIEAGKAETDEEKRKRERREKRTGFLARLADGLGTFHSAFSHARGIKPMDLPKMSAKAAERFLKASAEREKANERIMNYAINLGKMKDAEADRNFRLAHAKQQQDNWQRTFDAGREDKERDAAYRERAYEDSRKDRADDVAFRDRNFEEGKRQFSVTARASERESERKHAETQDGKYTEFYSGNGIIRIPNARLNQHNIAYVFSKTPAEGRPAESRNTSTGVVTPLTTDQMMSWIGSNIDDPNVQGALRDIGVQAGNNRTMPGIQTGNNRTMPGVN